MQGAKDNLGNKRDHRASSRLVLLSKQLDPVGCNNHGSWVPCNAEESQFPLDGERKQVTFNVRELTFFLDGQEYTEFKELATSLIENDESLRDEFRFDQTRGEARRATMAKIKKTIELWNQDSNRGSARAVPRNEKSSIPKKTIADAFWDVMRLSDASWAIRIGVHYGLFLSTIQGQGTEEQQHRFLDDIQNARIFGCYAMTELGHGSYVRGIETTASYDPVADEFVINSPTDTSTKWWIGMAGQTATHAAVFARLLIKDTDYGVHCFIVQVRSLEDGSAMPGIEIGDCGAKMGRNGLDNGWIQFHNVRIPRTDMLMRWAKVEKGGEYIKPPKAQLSYGTLIGGRVGIIQDSSDCAKKALTIAIRYSAVRRQFPSAKDPSKEEKILDYQSHQFRLMPLLATCYAWHFTASQIRQTFDTVQQELDQGDISNLVGLHATSAGLKAYSTWWCNDALEKCRQCLGGHGYSSYSGIPAMLADFAVMCTWEGDNTVMSQQTAKFLIKTWKKAQKGTPLSGFEKYLANAQSILRDSKLKVTKATQLLQPEIQLQILRRNAVRLISKGATRLMEELKQTNNKEQAFNECAVELMQCAKAHCDYYMLHCFVAAIAQGVETKKISKELAIVVKKLCDLHAMITIETYATYLLEDGFANQQQLDLVRQLIRMLCKEIRKEAIGLVDAFNVADVILQSPLGRYDGQVYKYYLETVKKAPNATGIPSYWEESIKPLLHTKKQQQ